MQIAIAAVVIVVVVGAAAAYVLLPALTPGEPELRIAVCMPANINDFAWNYQMYVGAQEVADAYPDVTVDTFLDLGQGVAAKDVFIDLAGQGYQILIGHTFEFGVYMQDIAPDFPNTIFVASSLRADNISNTFGYGSAFHETGYVIGVLAASITQTGKVGYMDGFKSASTNAYANGYWMGVQSVNPATNVSFVYANSWEDMDLAREQAQALIDLGFDNILVRTSVPGGIQAGASNPGTYIYGAETDQRSLGPKTVMASMISNRTQMLEYVIQLYNGEHGGFVMNATVGPSPQMFYFGMALGGAYVAFNNVLFTNSTIVPLATQALVQEVITNITSGILTVEYNTTSKWDI
jgi:basic membrane protein A